jgi:hypothetical protein
LEVQGNEEADRLAKEQARSHLWLLALQGAVRDQSRKVEMALAHIAGLACSVVAGHGGWNDFDVDLVKQLAEPRAPAASTSATGTASRAAVRLQHEWFADGERLRCAACFVTTATAKRHATACSGHPAAAMVASVLQTHPVVMGHALWKTGIYVGCSRCRAHGSKAPTLLKKLCKGWLPNGPSVRGNLASGRAPTARRDSERIGAPFRFSLRAWLAFQVLQDGRRLPAWNEAISAIVADEDVSLLDMPE